MMQDPKHRRGGQPKPAAERKRNNLTFRVRDQLRADLEKAAAAASRSVSEQIEYLIGRAFEWERVLGELEAFKQQRLADSRTRLAEARAPDRGARGGNTMKIPKGADLQIKTESGTIELHVVAAITTKQAADELVAAIQTYGAVLPQKRKRGRKTKIAAVA